MLIGTGFCRPGGGGSRIAIEIDDGSFKRLDQSVHTDGAVWQIIDADTNGRFRTSIRVPESDETVPSLDEGMHRLRLVTGKLRTRDPARSLQTAEFVVGGGNHTGVLPEPTSSPQPVDPALALVGAKGGAVTIERSETTLRLVVPELGPGDWVFPYAFGSSEVEGTRAQPARWVQLDSNRSVAMDLADLPGGDNSRTRVSVQSRDGTLVGWAPVPAFDTVTVAAHQPPTGSGTGDGDDHGTAGPTPARRPLVLIAGIAALLIGLAWTVAARQRRLRRIQELNRQ